MLFKTLVFKMRDFKDIFNKSYVCSSTTKSDNSSQIYLVNVLGRYSNFNTVYLILKSLKYVAKCITEKNLYYFQKFLRCLNFKCFHFF